MKWSYRVIRHATEHADDPFVFTLNEVYYGEDGTPSAWTENPIHFESESLESLTIELSNALRDADQMPTLEVVDGKLVEL
jgi:hypothetical protein